MYGPQRKAPGAPKHGGPYQRGVAFPRPRDGTFARAPIHAFSDPKKTVQLGMSSTGKGNIKFQEHVQRDRQLNFGTKTSDFLPSDGLTESQQKIEANAIKFQRQILALQAKALPKHLAAVGESVPLDCDNLYMHHRRKWQLAISPDLAYRAEISKLADPLFAGDELSASELKARNLRVDEGWSYNPAIDPLSMAVTRVFSTQHAKRKRHIMHQFVAWMYIDKNRNNTTLLAINPPFFIHNVMEFALTRLFLDYSDVLYSYTLVSQILLYDRLLLEDLKHPMGIKMEHDLYIAQLRHAIRKEGELHKARPILITDLLRLLVSPDLCNYPQAIRVGQEDFSTAIFGTMIGQRAATLLAINPVDVVRRGDALSVKLWSAKVFNKRGTEFIAGCGCLEGYRGQFDAWLQAAMKGIGPHENLLLQAERSKQMGNLLMSQVLYETTDSKVSSPFNFVDLAQKANGNNGTPFNQAGIHTHPDAALLYAGESAQAICRDVPAGANSSSTNSIARDFGKGRTAIPVQDRTDLRVVKVDVDNLDHDHAAEAQKRFDRSKKVQNQKRKSSIANTAKTVMNTVYPLSSADRRTPSSYAQYIRLPAFCPLHGPVNQTTLADVLPVERNLNRLLTRLKCTRHSFRRTMVLWAVLAEHAGVVFVDWDQLAKQLQWTVQPGTSARDGMVKYYTSDWKNFLPIAHLIAPAPACSAILQATNNFSAMAQMAAKASEDTPALVMQLEQDLKRKREMPDMMVRVLAGAKDLGEEVEEDAYCGNI